MTRLVKFKSKGTLFLFGSYHVQSFSLLWALSAARKFVRGRISRAIRGGSQTRRFFQQIFARERDLLLDDCMNSLQKFQKSFFLLFTCVLGVRLYPCNSAKSIFLIPVFSPPLLRCILHPS